MPICDVCFRHCQIVENSYGFCGGRTCRDGKIISDNYGKITSIALDPIEKKPLKMFHPGKKILSIGSYGCNLHCPFCQNNSISWSKEAFEYRNNAEQYLPEDIVEISLGLRERGNIGVAFTYNEPLIGYEFVKDVAKLSKKAGLKNVLVTNGTATEKVLNSVAPYLDAMNIDLKAFNDNFYKDFLKGDFETVKDFIKGAVQFCHVELTTLIIPDENDNVEEMRELSKWVSSLEKQYNKNIPLHVTRFFPTFKLTNKSPTPFETIFKLIDIAKENLDFVFTGNV